MDIPTDNWFKVLKTIKGNSKKANTKQKQRRSMFVRLILATFRRKRS